MKKLVCLVVVAVGGLLGGAVQTSAAAVTPDPFFCCKMNAVAPKPVGCCGMKVVVNPIHGYRVMPRRFRMLPHHEYKLVA